MKKKTRDPNNPELLVGNTLYGYKLERMVQIAPMDGLVYELTHIKTGARHIHISTPDRENTFGVAFRTIPTDSSGVAHILEHTVLCGSRKYPVRDPFFSMLKRSLSTFMNAFTASDWTMYPFATQNQKDFYNLMGVYLDAVFYPNLNPLSFKQEGHRLELAGEANGAEGDSPAAGLVYKGVVYNEMKGAMSSPDQVLVRSLLNAMYPDTTYRHNSGGDPEVIPNLTYEQLKEFHSHHYHPSNAYFYTYGNLAVGSHLEFIENHYLKAFEPKTAPAGVKPQPRWDKAKTHTYYYPLGPDEDPAKKYQSLLAWLLADVNDTFEVLALILLEQILMGNSASPLRKALIDSGLGTDLADGTGFISDNRDTLFACGLKDVGQKDAAKIEAIIWDVLNDLVTNGVDKGLIDAAVHQIEFSRKEITNSPYPYGISLLFSFAGSWLHGGDPVRILQFEDDFDRLHKALDKGRFFEERIKKYFLENTHRTLFTLAPDQQLNKQTEKREAAELAHLQKEMVEADLKKLKTEAAALQKQQEAIEDLASLPTLAIADIPADIQTVAANDGYPKLSAVCYRQPTSGVFYFTAAVSMSKLPSELVPLLPFFCYSLPKIGTIDDSYTDIVRKISTYTGGIGLAPQARTRFDDGGACLPFVTFSGKCLNRNLEPLFELLGSLFYRHAFRDVSRLKRLLLEYRAKMETAVIHSGHQLALSLAARHFSVAGRLNESFHGIHQLKAIKAVADSLDQTRLDQLATELTTIGQILLKPENLQTAIIGDGDALTRIQDIHQVDNPLLGTAPVRATDLSNQVAAHVIEPEGWHTATAVSFVAKCFPVVRMGHKDAPVLSVISRILRSMYLHREIREKGGAYGGFAIYKAEEGLFCFGSYRDPHVQATLQTYDKADDFLAKAALTADDVKEAILQVCADIDKPDPPGPAAQRAFYRRLIGLSDTKRAAFKQELLGIDVERIKTVAARYFGDKKRTTAVAVIANEKKLQQTNQKLGDSPLVLNRI